MAEMPFGYIVLEKNDHPTEVSNMQVIERPHLFYVRFDTILQSLDCRNRNGRQYSGDALVKGLSTPEIDELMRNNKWKGERDHPVSKDIQRIASVLSKCESHRIVKWWRDGNLIKGTIETLDDGQYGTALTRNILQGEVPSFSLRALAMLEKNGNTTFVNKPPRVITYDEVNLPSHKEAYADANTNKLVTTDGKTTTICENGIIEITASDVKEMVQSKSDNLKIVCESFDIDPNSVKIINQGRQLSVAREGETFIFALESKLARDINAYWKSLSK